MGNIRIRALLSTFAFCVPCVLQASNLSAQKADSVRVREYEFIIMDSPARLFTMRQFDQNYLSAYRLAVKELNKAVSPQASLVIQALASGLLFAPLTHEEGHRSILTGEKTGSISRPYFNKHLAAYVTGVTDNTLQGLRDSDLPVYIRLHTAGLESDYSLSLHSASLMNWGEEDRDVLLMEYFMRKVSLTAYYSSGLYKMKMGFGEEENELDRDIVGHDIYGAVRHLHRPDMEFYRYTDYGDLTGEEQKFVKRVGWRSLLNLIDPMLVGWTGWELGNGNKINFALGYGMVPFGDFIDQNVWLSTRSVKTMIYLREYQNRSTWFPAAGVHFADLAISGNLFADVTLHGWMQPEGLGFNRTGAFTGGAVDILCKYRFKARRGGNTALSVNLGIVAKTEGYLQEEVDMGEKIGVRFGTSIWLW